MGWYLFIFIYIYLYKIIQKTRLVKLEKDTSKVLKKVNLKKITNRNGLI
jgi:hypothetical protein